VLFIPNLDFLEFYKDGKSILRLPFSLSKFFSTILVFDPLRLFDAIILPFTPYAFTTELPFLPKFYLVFGFKFELFPNTD
jgi:hypothetical protein